ncbi:MAG: ribbon-helix-helix protein, CopG family [Nitriliruptorales bacterium]|nr:ribbon-helix-helix protein, CopG family [Nitriliruptorales bacterium]
MHDIMMHDEEDAMTKGFTVRLDDEQAEELEAVAKVDGVSVAEEIRQAISARIDERRNDAEFRKRLKQSIEDNKRILERLAQ